MSKPTRYPIPARETRVDMTIKNSWFIATGAYTPTVKEADAFVARIKHEFSDASHNCVAYRVGYGSNTAERASDDGEPSGTAGRPMISILQGQDLGDIAVVVTRYFGGIKLGTGGLVRAYSGAVRALLAEMPTKMQVEQVKRQLITDYSRFQPVKKLLLAYESQLEQEEFAADVTFHFTQPVDRVAEFDHALTELSSGQLTATETTALG